MKSIGKLYRNRFRNSLERKDRIWKVLVSSFFQKYVGEKDAVLDIAAGDCEFINHIKCGKKYAVDLNPAVKAKAGPGVGVKVGSCANLRGMFKKNYFDVVFASNIFEHLESKRQLESTLKQIHGRLKEGGILLVLQPNINYAYKEYWNFFDHTLPLGHSSMVEILLSVGFRITELKPKFLPYSTKQKLPSHPLLIWAYLRSRALQQIFGKQMFIVAKKAGP